MRVSRSLYFQHTKGHYKHYFLAIIDVSDPVSGDSWVLRTAYGRIGAIPKESTKGEVFRSFTDAARAMEVLAKDKERKGYDIANYNPTVPGPSWRKDVSTDAADVIASGGSNGGTLTIKKRTQAIFEKRKRTAEWRF